MSYHIVSIDAPQADLTCRDGQLVCTADGAVKKIPLEDIASIIITSFSARIHSHLFLEAARHGVSLVICEKFQPVSLLLPACRAADTLLTRRHLMLPDSSRRRLWEKTIDAKCANQAFIASRIAPTAPAQLNSSKLRLPVQRARKEAAPNYSGRFSRTGCASRDSPAAESSADSTIS